jgi:putative thiamine transport system substrate-binding protein
MLTRRAVLSLAAVPVLSRLARAGDWAGLAAEAKGQTVYFNAWAGSGTVNSYIAWAAGVVGSRFGITLSHVRVADTAEVVRRVRDEMKAGVAAGSVDLVWINGANFVAMKRERLLFGPFAESLPNFALVDVAGKPTTRRDFGEPVDGFEAPWGMAQLTFFGDGAKIEKPPRSMPELAAFAKENPGRVTYPSPPDFHGTTFVKQVLVETAGDASALARPISEAAFAALSQPAFALLDQMRPHLWRGGKQYPQSQAQVTQMVTDGELAIGLTFNPSEPANLVAAGRLPASTIAWQHARGTIGNTHFVAIPANARAKAAAQVVANFLLSPEAQARKADVKVWGDPTVLDIGKLAAGDARLFGAAQVPGHVSLPAPAIPEPDASVVPLVEKAWLSRYGA